MAMYGNVNNPIPAGPINKPQSQQTPPADYSDPKFQQYMLDAMTEDANKFASNDPNSMICPSCGGTGIKRNLPKEKNKAIV
jgi:hypothetical protein